MTLHFSGIPPKMKPQAPYQLQSEAWPELTSYHTAGPTSLKVANSSVWHELYGRNVRVDSCQLYLWPYFWGGNTNWSAFLCMKSLANPLFTRKGQNGRSGGRQQSETALWDCISILVCVCVPVEEWCVLEMVCVLPSGQWHLKQERGCVCVCTYVCSQRPIRASGPLCNPSVTVW